MEEKQALVSCIMPTYNRRQFVPNAIQYFLRQDYQNKELIIIDDGTDLVADLIPSAENIRYYSLKSKKTLGAKLNMACEYAYGNIIVNWDDDDWYASWRLSYQMEAMQEEGIELCGINNLLYYDLINKSGYNYIYPANQKVWLAGSSQCYKKTLWRHNKFEDINVGLDGLFVWATPAEKVKVLPDSSFSVHMIHQKNGSAKKTAGSWWHTFPIENIQKIIGEDWVNYTGGSDNNLVKVNGVKIAPVPIEKEKFKKPIQNVFACLVHEKEDCILDLVRNLYYQDPDSHILLYNGSGNPRLIEDKKLYEKFGAIWHPAPKPQRHGYLHGFALDCMAFATENLSFDTMTIVDSDQLCIRAGYSKYLSVFLSDKPNIGLLSSQPERITTDNRHNHVALQAFKEYNLWKPLLDTFEDGENKFVHWTFWPSTVFTYHAIRDLLELFKENTTLQHIMSHTKIWATEEVIFPTLIKLLGYDIASNPCCYDFVKYKVNYGISNLEQALKRKDVFWMHPVERQYEHPLRKHTRKLFQQYNPLEAKIKSPILNLPLGMLEILEKIKKIKGWLTDKEADLLATTTIKACLNSNDSIVEIGSYHGKATIILGSIGQLFFPKVKIAAIDPHDGCLGSSDIGIQKVTPSHDYFAANIHNAGLANVVTDIQEHTYNVQWEEPISLLLIDGLHDYENVSRDFYHFSNWLKSGSFVAFHDYAEYYPGVKTFVNELLNSSDYITKSQADSLIVLQKIK